MSRLYRLALRTFPAIHRATYADEMTDTFERALIARRTRGRWSAFTFVLAACFDAVRAGLGERRRHAGRVPNGRSALGYIPHDLAHAARSLARARGFSFVSIVSLGIGLGVVIAMVMLLRVVIGTPPGFTREGLVELVVMPQYDTWSYPDFDELRAVDTGMTLAGWTPGHGLLRAPDGAAVRVDAMYVSPNYFPVLGVALARGPGFTPTDVRGQPEVIVAHRLWRNRLGADPEIIGRTIVVNGTPHVVVGVTPEAFRGHLAQHRPGFQLFLPLAQHPLMGRRNSRRFDRSVDWVQILGRLAPETSLTEANAVVASIMEGFAQRSPATNRLKSASVVPYYPLGARGRADVVGEVAIVAAACKLVLLVVCLNMSGLVLVRSATRERELAVRLAIGASRARLMQYLLSEAVVLSLLGGALAVAVILGVPFALAAWVGGEADGTELGQMSVDGPLVAGIVGLCLLASLVFGLLPAIRFSRPKVLAALKDDAGGGGRRVGRVHRWTVAVQAGLAVPFLVVAGVQLDQFRKTANANLGFDATAFYAVPLDPGAASGAGDADFVLRTVQGHLRQADDVTAVAFADGLPLDTINRKVTIVRDSGHGALRARTTRVSPTYLESIGVRVLRGRGITPDDRAGSEPVVVISQALAAALFPEGDPIGQRITFALGAAHAAPDVRWSNTSGPLPSRRYSVIGVSDDLVGASLGPPEPQLFVPLAQHPAPHVYVIARSSASPQAMTSAFQRSITGLYADADAIATTMFSGERLVRRGRSELVYGSALAAIASGAALLLAALGVFGVVGFMVATRTREIGIRIALGASRALVMRNVLGDAVKLAAWGVAGGLGLAFLWERELSWSPVGAVESLNYLAAVTIALGVAMLASLPAARRAAAVEPIVAMRAE